MHRIVYWPCTFLRARRWQSKSYALDTNQESSRRSIPGTNAKRRIIEVCIYSNTKHQQYLAMLIILNFFFIFYTVQIQDVNINTKYLTIMANLKILAGKFRTLNNSSDHWTNTTTCKTTHSISNSLKWLNKCCVLIQHKGQQQVRISQMNYKR